MLAKYWGHFILCKKKWQKNGDHKAKIRCQQPAGSNFGVKARFLKNFNNSYRFLVPVLILARTVCWKDSQENMNNWCFTQDADVSIVEKRAGEWPFAAKKWVPVLVSGERTSPSSCLCDAGNYKRSSWPVWKPNWLQGGLIMLWH